MQAASSMRGTREGQDQHRFEALEISLALIRCLRPVVGRLEQRDRGLARQLREAASSVALNLGEGRRRVGKDRLHFWRIAGGSAGEVLACLRVAEAWGHLGEVELHEALGYTDSLLAITWRLTH